MPFDEEPTTVETWKTMTDVIPSRAESKPEPISPELALVSPELRERARALLPDRPWEAFVPPAAGPPDPIPFEQLEPLRQGVPAAPGPSPRTVDPGRRTSRRRVPRALLTPAVVALVFAAIAWASERTPEPGFLARSPNAPAKQLGTSVAGSGRPARSTGLPPVPSGGYVFSGGALVADSQGQTVSLTLWQGCAAGSGTRSMPVVDGRFHYTGRARERKDVRLHLEGRFVDTDTARLTVFLRGPGCPPGTRIVVARLS